MMPLHLIDVYNNAPHFFLSSNLPSVKSMDTRCLLLESCGRRRRCCPGGGRSASGWTSADWLRPTRGGVHNPDQPVHNAPMRHNSGCHLIRWVTTSDVHTTKMEQPQCAQPWWITVHNDETKWQPVHNAPTGNNQVSTHHPTRIRRDNLVGKPTIVCQKPNHTRGYPNHTKQRLLTPFKSYIDVSFVQVCLSAQ